MPSRSLTLQKWGVEVPRTQCGKLSCASPPSSRGERSRTTHTCEYHPAEQQVQRQGQRENEDKIAEHGQAVVFHTLPEGLSGRRGTLHLFPTPYS